MEQRSNAAPLALLSRKKIAKDEEVNMEESTMAHYTALSENQLNISFDIDTPYDILSNGKMVRYIVSPYKSYSSKLPISTILPHEWIKKCI